jgi:HAD superfamily hydrolase (TIGR01549 family)
VIAFDFDGVIADSMALQADAWRNAARRIGVSPQVRERLIDNFWMGAAGLRIFEHTGLGSGPIQQLRQTKDAEFERLETTITVFEHSPQVLNSLKQAGHYKLAIATTAEKSRVENFLKRHSLVNCIDYVITDENVIRGKPDEEMLLSIAEHFECQPWQVCLVGDTHTDYDMSSNAGTDFMLFQSHEALGVPAECVTARTWRQLEEILLGKKQSEC